MISDDTNNGLSDDSHSLGIVLEIVLLQHLRHFRQRTII